jgi:molybdate transport system regulatory protein
VLHLSLEQDRSREGAVARTRQPDARQTDANTKSTSDEAASEPQRARVKIQIDLPAGGRLGPGKIALLELIESEGSLSRAAEAMGISYRRAWLFVQQVNACFDERAVATPEGGHGGKAARLTDFGRELIGKFRELEQLANSQGERVVSWIARHEAGS